MNVVQLCGVYNNTSTHTDYFLLLDIFPVYYDDMNDEISHHGV
jgi:hypothetical protein